MELGEFLYLVSQRIIGVAESEFEKSNLPRSMQPIVIDSVKAYFLQAAYDNTIAVKMAQSNSQNVKPDDQAKETRRRSGNGLESLQESLKQDFGGQG